MVIQEWEATMPGQKLEIPADVTKRLRYRVVVERLNNQHSVCWCEEVEHEPMIESLRLKYVMFDSSDRHQGITLCARRTLHSEVRYLGKFTATVMPVGSESL
jgi:hypothetical protein